VWGVFVRNKNKRISSLGDYKPSFWEVIKTIVGAGYYLVAIIIGLFICGFLLGLINIGPDRILGEFSSLTYKVDALRYPGLFLCFFLSAFCLNTADNVHPYKSSTNAKTIKMVLAFSVWVILNIALIVIAFYLYFSGEEQIATWFIVSNVVAFLIVRFVRAPGKWGHLRFPSNPFLLRVNMTMGLLGILRAGVVLFGGWLYLVFLQLQISTDWLVKFAFGLENIHHQKQTPSMQSLLASVVVISIGWIIIQFLIVFALRNRITKGKLRAQLVILLNILPIIFTLWIWIKQQNLYLSTILLLTGSVVGFLFLSLAPEKPAGFVTLYAYSLFYVLILGAVCLVSNGVEGVLPAMIFQLFILVVGIAVGINIRLLISKYDIKAFTIASL